MKNKQLFFISILGLGMIFAGMILFSDTIYGCDVVPGLSACPTGDVTPCPSCPPCANGSCSNVEQCSFIAVSGSGNKCCWAVGNEHGAQTNYCSVSGPGSCRIADSSSYFSNSYARCNSSMSGVVPDSYNGKPCDMRWWSGALFTDCDGAYTSLVYEATSKSCVSCSGKTESSKYYGTGDYCPSSSGDSKCESACGASSQCDEQSSGSNVSVSGGRCDSCVFTAIIPPGSISYNLTVSQGSGTICASSTCTSSSTTAYFSPGTWVSISASPSSGYSLNRISASNGSSFYTSPLPSFQAQANGSFYAYFNQIYTPPSCKASGQSCVFDSECCSGLSCPGGHIGTCSGASCLYQGEYCNDNSECCSGTCYSVCWGITCLMGEESCYSNDECCSGSCNGYSVGICIPINEGCNLNRTGDYVINYNCVLTGSHHISNGNLTVTSGGNIQMDPNSSLTFDAGKTIIIEGTGTVLKANTNTIIQQQ